MELDREEVFTEEEDMQKNRFMVFSLDGENFGIEIRFVDEIIMMQSVAKLPEVPDYIRGVINLRGKIVPVVDMRLKFMKKEAPYTDRTCIVIVTNEDITVGLIVDGVNEVRTIPDEEIAPPPDKRTGAFKRYLMGIAKAQGEILFLMDCNRIFENDETKTIEQIGESEQVG
jgi:purine-binding chemotaxis protein CheW